MRNLFVFFCLFVTVFLGVVGCDRMQQVVKPVDSVAEVVVVDITIDDLIEVVDDVAIRVDRLHFAPEYRRNSFQMLQQTVHQLAIVASEYDVSSVGFFDLQHLCASVKALEDSVHYVMGSEEARLALGRTFRDAEDMREATTDMSFAAGSMIVGYRNLAGSLDPVIAEYASFVQAIGLLQDAVDGLVHSTYP